MAGQLLGRPSPDVGQNAKEKDEPGRARGKTSCRAAFRRGPPVRGNFTTAKEPRQFSFFGPLHVTSEDDYRSSLPSIRALVTASARTGTTSLV